MVKRIEEFREEFLNEIRNDSKMDGSTPDQYFFTYMLNKLEEMGEITDPNEIQCAGKICRDGKEMSLDAYSYDESDKSIVLYINDFKDSLEASTLNKADIVLLHNKMLNFLEEAYDNRLSLYFDESNEILKIGKDFEKRLRIEYINLNNDLSIDKIKMFVITNKKLSERIKFSDLDFPFFHGKRVIVNIWSIQRIYDLFLSGRTKEPVTVSVNQFGFNGIPCIKAEMSNTTDYDAYLAIIPGKLLHSIYYEYGSRLLEGNVRAFLSNKGKINKGIRNTIINEPTKFFTYNNGIACTAQSVELNEDGSNITKINDLQIINGGQTTASLTSAVLNNQSQLENVFVPLKLTVVKDDDYDTVISNISKYANSQNKVTDGDLFSNHPFHRRFEDLAKKYPAPAKDDEFYDTLWYYERSRGKYEQEKFKLKTKKQIEDFEKKRPKNQVLKKEDIAKYYMAANELRPDIVSKGSQKCMFTFATHIDDIFSKHEEKFNEAFYKKMICYAILYRETDRIVNNAKNEWYNVGGYKLNIVPYSVAKLMTLLPTGYYLNYNIIWKKQALPQALIRMLKKITYVTNQYIQKTAKGVIVTEHCKKEETWKKYRDINDWTEYVTDEYNFDLDQHIYESLIAKKVWEDEEIKAVIKEKDIIENTNLSKIYEHDSKYWERLIDEGTKRNCLGEKEIDIMRLISDKKSITDAQAKIVSAACKKLDKAGTLV